MDEIESIWEKVRSAAKGGKETEWRDRKSPIRFVSRERVAKTPTLEVTARPARPLPSIHDSKDGIFLKFVFRAKLPQNVLSDGAAFVFGRYRQTRALILIGDRVTATRFSWSAK